MEVRSNSIKPVRVSAALKLMALLIALLLVLSVHLWLAGAVLGVKSMCYQHFTTTETQ
jgi:hypothetical protein